MHAIRPADLTGAKQARQDCPDEESFCVENEAHALQEDSLLLSYLRDVVRYPLLTPEEETELAFEIRKYQDDLIGLFRKIPVSLREVDKLKKNVGTTGRSARRSSEGRAGLIEQVLSRLRNIEGKLPRDKETKKLVRRIRGNTENAVVIASHNP